MRKIIRPLVPIIGAALLAVAMAAPAAAHFIEVDPPGNDKVVEGWVGGAADPESGLPESAQGKGLIFHPPSGNNQPPSHAKGLNTACETIRENGNGTVDIFGPLDPATCEHGPPPAE